MSYLCQRTIHLLPSFSVFYGWLHVTYIIGHADVNSKGFAALWEFHLHATSARAHPAPYISTTEFPDHSHSNLKIPSPCPTPFLQYLSRVTS